MIEKINPMFYMWGEKSAITSDELAALRKQYPKLPQDHYELIEEVSDMNVELIRGDEYFEPGSSDDLYIIGLYSPREILDAPVAYSTVKRICDVDTDAVAIGMDGGDSVFIYMHGGKGWGLYLLRLSDQQTVWVASTLSDLLIDGTGIEACLEHSYG